MAGAEAPGSMIPKSGTRFSDKTMLEQETKDWSDP